MATSIEQTCEARLGQVLKGKWTLERVLGIGGMAAVYVAQHKIGRREAIKILHPEVARDAEQRKRFEQEARAANTLTHPGMVEVRDIDVTDDGCPFMVMELLEGETLADLANRLNGLPVPDLLRFVDEILDVLAVAHEHGIVHRDIKLGNLFVTAEGRIKVLDFGIARLATSQITRVGARLGTAAYMPPEQIKGQQVDGRADLFAVGATMFRLLAKRRVHEAPSEAELLVKMASDPAPLLATVCDAPPDVCLVVDRALAYRAADRYPDARTMQQDVQALRRGDRPAYAAGAIGGITERSSATRAEAPRGRVVGAANASSPTLLGPSSTTLPTGAPPTVIRRAADAYAATGYDVAPPSVRVAVGGATASDAIGSAATIMPTGAGMAHLGPGSGAASASAPTSGGYAVPLPSGPASTRSSWTGDAPSSVAYPPASVAQAPASMGYPPASVAQAPQVVVSPASMRGHVVPTSDDTALALQPGVPPPARSGPSPIILGAIGGAVFFVLAIVLLVAVGGDDETAPAEGASGSAAGPVTAAPSVTGPRVSPFPGATGPAVTPQKAPGGPPRSPGHPSLDAPGRNR